MRLLYVVLMLLTLVLFIPAQEKAAPQANERIKLSVDKLLRPADDDRAEAKRLGARVFRILPRETYDGKIAMRGGGAYYSFVPRYGYITNETNPSLTIQDPVIRAHTEPETSAQPSFVQTARLLPPHFYGYGSDLELQRGKFGVGFAGADYGFLYDLGEFPLDFISKETPEVVFLNSYEPPSNMIEIRAEQSKIFHTPAYEANGFRYQRSVPALVGHTYILRSINFRRSDVLVALKVYRQDTDGSLIVFWKKLKTFETPEIDKSN